jgi:hypothetical protein
MTDAGNENKPQYALDRRRDVSAGEAMGGQDDDDKEKRGGHKHRFNQLVWFKLTIVIIVIVPVGWRFYLVAYSAAV